MLMNANGQITNSKNQEYIFQALVYHRDIFIAFFASKNSLIIILIILGSKENIQCIVYIYILYLENIKQF